MLPVPNWLKKLWTRPPKLGGCSTLKTSPFNKTHYLLTKFRFNLQFITCQLQFNNYHSRMRIKSQELPSWNQFWRMGIFRKNQRAKKLIRQSKCHRFLKIQPTADTLENSFEVFNRLRMNFTQNQPSKLALASAQFWMINPTILIRSFCFDAAILSLN